LPPKPQPVADRIRRKVVVDEKTGCWNFTGAKHNGYGWVSTGTKDRPQRAHRLMWETTHGPIPSGLRVLHKCDNRACCNPDHLFLGTQRDNVADMFQKGRAPQRWGKLGSLTPDQVREIRASSLSNVELAAKYGIWRQTIYKVRNRLYYSWVD